MSLRLGFVVAVGVSGVVFACSGSGTRTGSGSATSADAFISEFCSLYAPCCGKVNQPTDGAQCRALYQGLTGSRVYDSAKGSACLAELRAQNGSAEYCANPSGPSCKAAFTTPGGAKQPGEDCSQDGDCALSAEGEVSCASSFSGSVTTRSCQVAIDGKEGDTPCLGTRDGTRTSFSGSSFSGDGGSTRPPARGYICDVAKGVFCSTRTKACARVQELGGDCETSASAGCVKTTYCNYTTRKCAPRVAIGEDCSSSTQACVANAVCDTKTRKCIATLEAGAACTSSAQCTSSSCVNGKCGAPAFSELSTKLLCGG